MASFGGAFFSVFFSSFVCAPAGDATKAELAANIAATITDSSLFISFSCFNVSNGAGGNLLCYPEGLTRQLQNRLTPWWPAHGWRILDKSREALLVCP